MSKKNKNKKSKFGLFATLAAIAGVGIYLFTKDSEKENATTQKTKEAEAKTAADLAEEAAKEAAKEAAEEAAEETAEETASSAPTLEIVPDYDTEEALAILTTSDSVANLSKDEYLNILKYYSIPYFKVIHQGLWNYVKLDPNRFDVIPYNRNGIEVPYIIDNKTLTLISKENFNSDFFNVFYNNIYNHNHGNLIDTVKITLADGRQGYVYTARKMYNKSPYFQYVIALRDAEKAAEKAKEEASKTEDQKAKEAAEKAEAERQLIEAFKTAFEKNIIL